VAVSDGAPRLFEGDCRPADGPSEDVCFISREMSGELFALLLRNPAALSTGTLPVEDPGCVGCDDVTGVAVVEVRIGEAPVLRATGGELVLSELDEGLRYTGRLRLRFPQGTLSGEFDVTFRE
jgi:hypothetical protein